MSSLNQPKRKKEIEDIIVHSWASYCEEHGNSEDENRLSAVDHEFFFGDSTDIFSGNADLTESLRCGFQGRTEKFTLLEWIDKKSTDTEAYIAQSEDKKKVVFSIRGSESLRDWTMNAQTWQTRWEPKVDGDSAGCCSCLDCLLPTNGKPMVHLGFYKIFLKLRKYVETTLVDLCKAGDVEEVIFAGHSLGGAVATLCFSHFIQIPFGLTLSVRKIKATLGTVGSPRVGDDVFVSKLLERKQALATGNCCEIIRVVNSKDVVPTIPARVQGYKHVGRPVYFEISDDDDDKIFFYAEESKNDYDENENDEKLLTAAGISQKSDLTKSKQALPQGGDYNNLLEGMSYHKPVTYLKCVTKATPKSGLKAEDVEIVTNEILR
ncbi:hypothetical protein ScalyP_jg7516 [Parmales sp. scaly parma]|nr:hypothetical protein ScalyP_jg7516 [Parmales sp. scaly parma]